MTASAPSAHHDRPVNFTIDGQPFSSDQREQLAGTLLKNFAHLDPADYQLGELHGHDPTPKLFNSDEIVHLHEGARFVSVRTGPGPVE